MSGRGAGGSDRRPSRVDVLIVGAGSAGCVLAGRLSEDPRVAVGLIEAGPDPEEVPDALRGPDFTAAMREPGRTWTELTARISPGRTPAPYVRGRGMGGSSSVNALVGMLGPTEDYDRWASVRGCDGWDWSSLSASADRVVVPRRTVPPAAMGTVCRTLLAAGTELGYPTVADHDAPGAWGFGPAALTLDGSMHRVSASDVYVEPARSRPNLFVWPDSTVARIVFDGARASGVELADGEVVEASEVVVSAGAIHSPALLLRSGVVRQGLGRNLQDHPAAAFTLELRDGSVPGGLAIGALARLSSGVDPNDLADLQLLPLSHLGPDAPGIGILSVALMSVHSRGSVTLDAGSPVTRPTVEIGALTDERDALALVAGARIARRVLETRAMREAAASVYLDDRGTSLESLGDDDESILQWLRSRVGDYVHASGTCRMGSVDDPTAVVGPDLRVIGHEGLRVCDTSVFPQIPRANTHLPAVLVAEHLARLIAEERP